MMFAYVLYGIAAIGLFTTVGVDDSWYTQPAWSFATNGTFSLPMFADLAGVDRENIVMGRVYLLIMAVAYMLGGPHVEAVQAVSFLCGLVALVAVFGIGTELWSQRVGALAAVLLAVAPNFVWQSHDARPEIMLVAFWTVALYLVLSGDRRGTRWRLLAGGLVAGLSVDVHFNGAAFALGLFGVLLVRRSSPRAYAYLTLGLAAAFAWWAWVHILPGLSLFREQMSTFTTADPPLVDLLSRPVQIFLLEAARYALVLPRASVVLAWVAILAAILLLRHQRDRSLLCLLALTAIVFVFMALVTPHRVHMYAVLLWPVFALLVARLLTISARPVAIGLGGAVITLSLVSIGASTWQSLQEDYHSYVQRLSAEIPHDATVQGDPFVWYGFTDRAFIAAPYFVLTDSYADEVSRLGIDYVVLDSPTLGSCPDCSYATEVADFLAQHGELVAVIDDPFLGPLVAKDGEGFETPIYRIAN